jgi:hypothetical protein
VSTVVPADGRLLVVGFDPSAEPLRLEAFRGRYHLDGNVRVLGPFRGHLDNGEGDLRLVRPGTPLLFDPLTDPPTQILVDRVHYHDSTPWPAAADGAGHSLQRLDDAAFGNDVANWTAAAPTPGGGRIAGHPPVIVVNPRDQFVPAGGSASFETFATANSAVRYQWLLEGGVINGATNDTLVIPNVQLPTTGTYSVLALTAFGWAASQPATLGFAKPLTISQAPNPQRIAPGQSATFTVIAVTGNPPLSYQWYFGGVPIAGATAAAYTIPSVSDFDQGLYSVKVTDGFSSLVTVPVALSVVSAPSLVAPVPPLSLTAVAGQPLTLSARTRGATPMLYRWEHRQGNNPAVLVAERMLDGDRDFLVLPNVTPADAGTYTLSLTNEVQAAADLSYTIAEVTILPDGDGDGLPDGWETDHGLRPDDPTDASLDLDEDGATNLEEYIAGTDPADPASYLRIDRVIPGEFTSIQFNAVAGRTYTVQFTDSLFGHLWARLADVEAGAESHVATVFDLTPIPGRFYRLITPRAP